MMPVKNGQASVILRVKLLDSSSTVGAGLTGLTNSSSGLIISTIADNESTATAYTQAGTTIQTITTLGTYAAPSASNCRFKEVDSTNHKGVYEIQLADARFAVSSAKSLLVSVSGATNLAQADFIVPLVSDDPYVAKPTNYAALVIDGSGRVDVSKIGGTSQTARDLGASVLLSSGTGTGQISLSSGTVTVGTNSDKTGYSLSQSFPTNFSSLSIDASGRVDVIKINGTSQTARDIGATLGVAGAGLTALGDTRLAHLDADVSSRLATGSYTAPDNTSITSIKAKTDLIPGTIDGKTFAELVTLMAAVLLGKASGLDTATAIFRALDDSKDRVTATHDSNGNRTAVTLDAS